MSLDFLILYEHIQREYESITLLKLELEKRGYTAEIMQLLDTKKLKYFTYKKPKVLVASAMYDNKTMNSFVYNNVGVCNKVVNLNWEQVRSAKQETLPFFNSVDAASYALHTCWGEKSRERLINSGVPLENTVITGPLQMDFLRSEYEGYYKDKKAICKEFNLDENKQVVLYISTFSTAYMSDEEVNALNVLAGVNFDNFKATSKKTMDETLKWTDEFLSSEKGKEVEFIYRRHPSEWNSPILEAMAKKHSNFHLISDYSVKQWIKVSDIILTWMSTAIVEVYFAKKSCFVIRPYPLAWEYDPTIYKGGTFIDNYEDFAKSFEIENQEFPLDIPEMLKYYDVSNTPSFIRMADVLEEVHNSEDIRKPFDYFTPKFSFFKLISLMCLHILCFIKVDPIKFKVFKSFSGYASRIYGHIKNTRVSRQEYRQYEENIKKYILK